MMNINARTKFELEGNIINLAEECKKRGLDYSVVYERIKYGQSVLEALSKPVRRKRAFIYKGQAYTLKDICKEYDLSFSILSNMIYINKIPFEQAVELYLSRKRTPKEEESKKKKSTNKFKKKVNKKLSPDEKAFFFNFLKVMTNELSKLNKEKQAYTREYNLQNFYLPSSQIQDKQVLETEFIEYKKSYKLRKESKKNEITEIKNLINSEKSPKRFVRNRKPKSISEEDILDLRKRCELYGYNFTLP